MTLRLRALGDRDVPALLAIHHQQAGDGPRWSETMLREHLGDAARDHGRRVVVAARGECVAGCAGWVEAPPWCFGAPVIAADDDAAALVIGHVVERARAFAADRLRISAAPGEPGKHHALRAAGFMAVFDFVTVVRPIAVAAASTPTRGRRIGWAQLDAVPLSALHNDTFAGVPNSAPLSSAEMRAELDGALVVRGATAAWTDDDGGYQAFVQVDRDLDPRGAYAEIAAIGVAKPWRGHGVAGAILDDVLGRVAAEVTEVRALIASTNEPSLRLHAGRGFVERARRTVDELAL